MLNVTYVYATYMSSIFKLNSKYYDNLHSTPYIMKSILNSQEKLNVTYSDSYIFASIMFKEIIGKNISKNLIHNKIMNNTINSIKTNYVLLTLGTLDEINFLIKLLKKGKKVVVGGVLTKTYTTEQLRKILLHNGAINLENLLIVRPYIDSTINLYKIIKEWKDVDIIETDTDTNINIYKDIDKNSIIDDINKLKKYDIKFGMGCIISSTSCKWGKCSFCSYCVDQGYEFITEENVDEVFYYLDIFYKKVGIKHFDILDPEFYFSKANIRLLELLRKNNYKAHIFSGIRLLKNKKHFNLIFNEYKDVIVRLKIGIESMDDVSLKLLNKGYTSNDVFNVIEKISKLKTDILINNIFMVNLAFDSISSIQNNYKKIQSLKDIYNDNDIKNVFIFLNYYVTPLVKYVENNPFLVLDGDPLLINNTYTRYDKLGKKINGRDFQIIDERENSLSTEMIDYDEKGEHFNAN